MANSFLGMSQKLHSYKILNLTTKIAYTANSVLDPAAWVRSQRITTRSPVDLEVAMYTAGLLGGGANKRHEDPGRGERVAHMLAKVTL